MMMPRAWAMMASASCESLSACAAVPSFCRAASMDSESCWRELTCRNTAAPIDAAAMRSENTQAVFAPASLDTWVGSRLSFIRHS
ncbi:MAG: hypothetical protein EDM74_06225 [Armatimonadetes bacterium]|nr:MAG: hypothetical protein EDM74_06225 [Armatimonadota bacterium]RIK00534.1 MAG: hypothetical protein DCC46_04680 [Armatimonadota bacterium]